MSERKIYLRMVGGLGNQLYQFSYAYYLLVNNKYDRLIIDSSGMGNYNEVWGDLLDIVFELGPDVRFIRGRSKILSARLPRVMRFSPWLSSKLGLIGDVNAEEILTFQEVSNLYLDGYFEDVKFRHEYRKLLHPLLKNLKVNVPPVGVAVNVRGGEYARLGLSSMNDRAFYEEAIAAVKAKIKRPKFYLITDDISYAKKLLSGLCDFYEIVEPDPEYNFKLLYSMPYKILSQSTFAKWAGYLSELETDVVYMKGF